jgi:hypothetical protein
MVNCIGLPSGRNFLGHQKLTQTAVGDFFLGAKEMAQTA